MSREKKSTKKIKNGIREPGGGGGWNQLVQDIDQLRALIGTGMKLPTSSKARNFWTICSGEFVRKIDPEVQVRFPVIPEFFEVVGLERGPFSYVSTTDLLGIKSSAYGTEAENTVVGFRHADHMASSIHKSWHQLRRQAAVARRVYPFNGFCRYTRSSLADLGHGV
jgi:hypothetical protein